MLVVVEWIAFGVFALVVLVFAVECIYLAHVAATGRRW